MTTLSVMALILTLILALSLSIALETKVAAYAHRQELARQNAQFGLHLAMAQLQEKVGPDQRITVPSHQDNSISIYDTISRNCIGTLPSCTRCPIANGDFSFEITDENLKTKFGPRPNGAQSTFKHFGDSSSKHAPSSKILSFLLNESESQETNSPFTCHAYGLLTRTTQGGYKRDLTQILRDNLKSRLTDQAPVCYSFFHLADSTEQLAIVPTPPILKSIEALEIFSEEKGDFESLDTESCFVWQQGVYPVIIAIRLGISLTFANQSSQIHYHFQIALWNPYDIAIQKHPYRVDFSFPENKGDFYYNIETNSISNQCSYNGDESNPHTKKFNSFPITQKEDDSQIFFRTHFEIDFKPGEVKIFTLKPNEYCDRIEGNRLIESTDTVHTTQLHGTLQLGENGDVHDYYFNDTYSLETFNREGQQLPLMDIKFYSPQSPDAPYQVLQNLKNSIPLKTLPINPRASTSPPFEPHFYISLKNKISTLQPDKIYNYLKMYNPRAPRAISAENTGIPKSWETLKTWEPLELPWYSLILFHIPRSQTDFISIGQLQNLNIHPYDNQPASPFYKNPIKDQANAPNTLDDSNDFFADSDTDLFADDFEIKALKEETFKASLERCDLPKYPILPESIWDDYYFSSWDSQTLSSKNPFLYGDALDSSNINPDNLAESLCIDGAFNINSLNPESWNALLSHFLLGYSTLNPYRDNYQDQDGSPFCSIKLSEKDISTLADCIVETIQTHGPLFSLQAWIYPRSAGESSLLEIAIQKSGLDSKIDASAILQALAPILSVRSDTFIIKAHGNVVNPSNSKIIARATCQAVLQRTPDRVGDVRIENCRRFKIIQFRWLNTDRQIP